MKIKLMIAIAAMAMTGFCAQAQTADSVQIAPTHQTEVKVPVNTGDNLAYTKALMDYVKAKFLACKSVDEMAALESDPVLANLEKNMEQATNALTEQEALELQKWMALPENNLEAIIQAKVKELMPGVPLE